MKTKFLLTSLILLLIFVIPVYASEDVNLSDLPQQLSEKLTIPLFAAQLLTTAIFLTLFLFPAFILTKNILAHIMIGFIIMGFCIAMEWLPYWFLIIIAMIVALMFSGKMRDWITGRGGG